MKIKELFETEDELIPLSYPEERVVKASKIMAWANDAYANKDIDYQPKSLHDAIEALEDVGEITVNRRKWKQMRLKELDESARALELRDLEDWYFDEKDSNLRERRDIPNVDGFKFIAVTHDGEKVKSKVIKRPNGTHGVRGAKFSDIKGWLPLAKE